MCHLFPQLTSEKLLTRTSVFTCSDYRGSTDSSVEMPFLFDPKDPDPFGTSSAAPTTQTSQWTNSPNPERTTTSSQTSSNLLYLNQPPPSPGSLQRISRRRGAIDMRRPPWVEEMLQAEQTAQTAQATNRQTDQQRTEAAGGAEQETREEAVGQHAQQAA